MKISAPIARRPALAHALAAIFTVAAPRALPARAYDAMPGTREIKSSFGYDLTPMSRDAVLTRAEKLKPLERGVSLQAMTERSFSGKTTNGYSHDYKGSGVWAGALSDLPLFSSSAKYDSGTGWPSFYAPIDPNHGTRCRART